MSWLFCMRISVSIDTPNAFSTRNAISGESCECTFTSVESVARVTPSARAAADTYRPSGSIISDFTKPPRCAGFFMRMPAIALMPNS